MPGFKVEVTLGVKREGGELPAIPNDEIRTAATTDGVSVVVEDAGKDTVKVTFTLDAADEDDAKAKVTDRLGKVTDVVREKEYSEITRMGLDVVSLSGGRRRRGRKTRGRKTRGRHHTRHTRSARRR